MAPSQVGVELFVAHFAAGLAMRGRDRRVPVAAYIGGAFALDFVWVALSVTGIDVTPWSDWSHSLVMASVWATALAAFFIRFGRRAVLAVWLVVLSHYVLDLLIQGATLYLDEPNAPAMPVLITENASVVQWGLTVILLLVFVRDEMRVGTAPWRILAACGVVGAMSLR